ncbi:MAG: tetratricopeptide repeat protein [Chloroflexota bacterium]
MLAAAERAAEIAAAIGHDRFLAWAEERRGSAFSFLGQPERARAALERAIPLLEGMGDLGRLQIAICNLGEAHRIAGELEDADRYAEQALHVGQRVGNPSYIALDLNNLGQIRLSLGKWTEAREYLERAEEVVAGFTSASTYGAYTPAMLSQLLLCTGDWDGAERQLERALGIAEVSEDRQVLEMIHLTGAELEILRGEPEKAAARLEALPRLEGGLRSLIEATLAWAQLEGGDVQHAAEIATQAVSRAREAGEVLALADALRVCGMVLAAQGRKGEAEEAFAEGLQIARSLPYPYAEARILYEMGKVDEALTIFQRLGARKDIERAEEKLAAPA